MSEDDEGTINKDKGNVVKLIIDNNDDLDFDDLTEPEQFRELLIDLYAGCRSLFALLEDDINRHNAILRLKESFGWAVGALDMIDDAIEEDFELELEFEDDEEDDE